MKSAIWNLLPAIALLTACSQKAEDAAAPTYASANGDAPQAKFGFKEAMREPSPLLPDRAAEVREEAQTAAASADSAARAAAKDSAGQSNPLSAAKSPRIAYAYSFGFRVSADNMPALQHRHAELCEKMGPQTCRVMEMSQSGGEDEYAEGQLLLEVAAPKAHTFDDDLAKAAEGTGARKVSSAVSGEDLTKQMINTEARLRGRLLLRDRLMNLLASHNGTVAELIEAERGVADVNEEIDEAQSLLNEMKGRVDFSRVEVRYSSSSRSGFGFLTPIRAVLGSLGMILGGVIAGLIVIAVALVPITLFFLGLRWIWRKGRGLLKPWLGGPGVTTATAAPVDPGP